MKVLDIFIFSIYMDGKGQMRKITKFYDGIDGERRVKYEIGFITDKGSWYGSGTFDCSKKYFARWAKDKVRAGYMCKHGNDSSICKSCESIDKV